MKTSNIVALGLLGAAILATPAVAEEKCGKNIINFSPTAGSYKQITPIEAQEMKNNASGDQRETSIILEPVGEKSQKDKSTNMK